MSDKIFPENTIQRCPHDEENPYVQIRRGLIRDKRISPECRFLIIYLLSNKDNWNINVKQLIKEFKGQWGKDIIYKIINEAIYTGYMKREKFILKGLERTRYYLSETDKFKIESPHAGFPEAVIPHAENQDAKDIIYSKKEYIEEQQPPKQKPVSTAASPVVVSLNKLNLSDSFKKKISKEFTEEEINIAVERCLNWPSRKSDQAALRYLLNNPHEWSDKKSSCQVVNQNVKWLQETLYFDGKKKKGWEIGVNTTRIYFATYCSTGQGGKHFEFKCDDPNMIMKAQKFFNENLK